MYADGSLPICSCMSTLSSYPSVETQYKKVLGRGSFKTVYNAFDSHESLEVAWNKLHVDRLMPEERKKVYNEVTLLRRLDHKNIIKLYDSFVSPGADGTESVDFITELMMSGTLKEYLKKAKVVKLKVIRRWCSNILEAIVYLHEQRIMHRDLKLDNLFINGHRGEVKIGDLGLSAVRDAEKVAESVIGTPEFMAPELYEECYTEKVDIYAFGMCLLEMVSMEYPYEECKGPAQIMKKVFNDERPAAFLKLVDSDVKRVIAQCLEREPRRPSAVELLNNPLFRDWTDDDGARSNLSLIYGTPESEAGNSLRMEHVSPSGLAIGDQMIAFSDNLKRDMVIAMHEPDQESKQTKDGDPASVFVVATEEGPAFSIGLQMPIGDGLKSISFTFFPGDNAEHLAQEMVAELHLDPSQVSVIKAEIESQVYAMQQQNERDRLALVRDAGLHGQESGEIAGVVKPSASRSAVLRDALEASVSSTTLGEPFPLPGDILPSEAVSTAQVIASVPPAIHAKNPPQMTLAVNARMNVVPVSNELPLPHAQSSSPPAAPAPMSAPAEVRPPTHDVPGQHQLAVENIRPAHTQQQQLPQLQHHQDVHRQQHAQQPLPLSQQQEVQEHQQRPLLCQSSQPQSQLMPPQQHKEDQAQFEFQQQSLLPHPRFDHRQSIPQSLHQEGPSSTDVPQYPYDQTSSEQQQRPIGTFSRQVESPASPVSLDASASIDVSSLPVTASEVPVPVPEPATGSARIVCLIDRDSSTSATGTNSVVTTSLSVRSVAKPPSFSPQFPSRADAESMPGTGPSDIALPPAAPAHHIHAPVPLPPPAAVLTSVPPYLLASNIAPTENDPDIIVLSPPPAPPNRTTHGPARPIVVVDGSTKRDAPAAPAVAPAVRQPHRNKADYTHVMAGVAWKENSAAAAANRGLHGGVGSSSTVLPGMSNTSNCVVSPAGSLADAPIDSTTSPPLGLTQLPMSAAALHHVQSSAAANQPTQTQHDVYQQYPQQPPAGAVPGPSTAAALSRAPSLVAPIPSSSPSNLSMRTSSWKSVHSDDSLFSSAQAGTGAAVASPSAAENEYDQRWYTTCLELMENAVRGRVALVQQKLNQGASVTFADYDRRTPLHLAASAGHSETCNVLIESGADVNARDRWGRTPMSDARAGSHVDVMEILRLAGGTDDEGEGSADLPSIEMLQFSAKGNLAAVKERIASGAPVTYTDYESRTALHLACSHGHADVTDFLLLNGADPGAKDKMGRTPVGNAVKNGHRNVLEVLKRNGADIPSHALGPDMRSVSNSMAQSSGSVWNDGGRSNGVVNGVVSGGGGNPTGNSSRPRSSPPPPEQMESLRTAMAISHSLSMGNIAIESDGFADQHSGPLTQLVSSSTSALLDGADDRASLDATQFAISLPRTSYDFLEAGDIGEERGIDEEHARLVQEYELEKSRLDAEHKMKMEGLLRKKTVSSAKMTSDSTAADVAGAGTVCGVYMVPASASMPTGLPPAGAVNRHRTFPTSPLPVLDEAWQSAATSGCLGLGSVLTSKPALTASIFPATAAAKASMAASGASILPFSRGNGRIELPSSEVYSTESPTGPHVEFAPALSEEVPGPQSEHVQTAVQPEQTKE
jgi:serine/threonine protein kinase/ankyrin repeat protein